MVARALPFLRSPCPSLVFHSRRCHRDDTVVIRHNLSRRLLCVRIVEGSGEKGDHDGRCCRCTELSRVSSFPCDRTHIFCFLDHTQSSSWKCSLTPWCPKCKVPFVRVCLCHVVLFCPLCTQCFFLFFFFFSFVLPFPVASRIRGGGSVCCQWHLIPADASQEMSDRVSRDANFLLQV